MPADQVPIKTKITREVIETLSKVTVQGGWRCDFEVEPYKAEGNNRRPGLVIVIQAPKDRLGGDGSGDESLGDVEWVQTYYLVCYAGKSENDNTPIDEKLNLIEADAELALTQDEGTRTRGGVATTELMGSVPFDDDRSKLPGIAIMINVTYRTLENDPYTRS